MTSTTDHVTAGVQLARIDTKPLDPAAVEAAVASRDCGAVVLFTGTIRNHDGGKAVSALEYAGHPQAQDFLVRVCAEVATTTGLRVAAVHRVGALVVGDLAVVVAVAAPHRGEAFAACANLIDRIKHEVPIWKRQHFADGMSEWVGACG